MFFVRKAAEPIGGDGTPLPGSAAVNAAGPSGRARCRHNRAPLPDTPVTGTTSDPSGRARYRHSRAPLLDVPVTGTAERPPKAHFGRSGETATCPIEASRMRFDFHFSSYARFVSVRRRVSCARMSQIEVSLQFLLFWVFLHLLPERQAFFVDTNRLKLENNGVENEHERSSDR